MSIIPQNQINQNPAAIVAREIAAQLHAAGHEAWFVGGGVRDLILGRRPKDFDIATSARPDTLKRLFSDSSMVGAKFGVFIVPGNGHHVEVATFREEGEYNDRRRPDLVKFSGRENDAGRRDFTVNALYYDPVADRVYDPLGGVDDIDRRVLRAVGDPDKRFQEDALRVIRGIRFAANLDFQVEPATWSALCIAAPNLRDISMERVRDELIRGFTGDHPARFLDLLDQSKILEILLPEILPMKGCAQPPQFHPEGDVYCHTRLLLENLKPDPSVALAFAVLLHDVGKPGTQTFEDRIRFNGHDKVGAEMSQAIGQRLRLSNNQIKDIGNMVLRHMQFINLPKMRASTLNRFLAEPTIDDELELHRVDCLASHGDLGTHKLAFAKLNEFRENKTMKGRLPKPLINGNDLISIGLRPGPGFTPILRRIFDAQMEGTVTSREEALSEAQKMYGHLDSAP